MFSSKVYKTIEFFILFLILPILFLYEIIPLFAIVPVLWAVSIYVFVILKIYEKQVLFKKLPRKQLRDVLIRFLFIASFIFFFTYYYHEKRLFNFILDNPKLYFTIMILYPLLSVLPQELIYRRFFVFRYKKYMSLWLFVLLNAFVFAFAHILFVNYIALVFTFFGGVLFINTYLKKKSFSLVCLEHSLYGNLLFTIGLGDFFYHNGNI